MFYNGGYMGGMHGGWWIFWLLMIGAALIYAWQRPGRRGDERAGTPHEMPQEKPHEILRKRLASGAITPQQYEESKTLLDRDS